MTEAHEVMRRELASLSAETVTRLIEVGRLVHIPVNWTPIHKGEPADEVYFILEGAVRVVRGDEQVALLESGAFAGEMGLVHRSLRSARVTVASPVLALAWPGNDFNQLREELPDFADFISETASARRTINAARDDQASEAEDV